MKMALDHLYAETADWEASVGFWTGLGFSLAEEWGTGGHRAGRLVGDRASVVLAEAAAGTDPPAFSVFFATDDLDGIAASGVEVLSGPEPSHWGTRWMRVRDPEGRVYSLEEGEEEKVEGAR